MSDIVIIDYGIGNVLSVKRAFAYVGADATITSSVDLIRDESEEFGLHRGLSLIQGKVLRISDKDKEGNAHKIPHVGWNSIADATGKEMFEEGILRGIKQGSS